MEEYKQIIYSNICEYSLCVIVGKLKGKRHQHPQDLGKYLCTRRSFKKGIERSSFDHNTF